MADHLSDIVLRLVRDRNPPSSYNRESPFQALKSSLDDSPPDPSRIAASKRLLLLPPYTPSPRLFSPHQAIQQALLLADYRIQTCFPSSQAHLFSKVIHHHSLPPHLGFSAKRDLLELLLLAPPPPSSSTLTLQAKAGCRGIKVEDVGEEGNDYSFFIDVEQEEAYGDITLLLNPKVLNEQL